VRTGWCAGESADNVAEPTVVGNAGLLGGFSTRGTAVVVGLVDKPVPVGTACSPGSPLVVGVVEKAGPVGWMTAPAIRWGSASWRRRAPSAG